VTGAPISPQHAAERKGYWPRRTTYSPPRPWDRARRRTPATRRVRSRCGPRKRWRNATRIALIAEAMIHSYDHYGQMVVYLRMNGIGPPNSRR